MQKNMLVAVGSGGLSAVASMAFFTGSPGGLLFVYISMLPIFLVAFSFGYMAGIIACGAGLLVALGMGGVVNGASYGILHAFPAWLVSRHCLSSTLSEDGQPEWPPVGDVLGVVALASATIMVLAGVYIAGDINGLQATVSSHITEVFSLMGLGVENPEFANLRDALVTVFPAALGISWVVMTILNALLAQNLLVRFEKNLRPSPSYIDMSLPQWVAVPMIVAAAIALASDGDIRYLSQNLTIVLAAPFFFLGLTVAHWAVRQVPDFRIPLIIGFYMILLISGWALAIVAAIGMAEQWWGLKDRFKQDTQ